MGKGFWGSGGSSPENTVVVRDIAGPFSAVMHQIFEGGGDTPTMDAWVNMYAGTTMTEALEMAVTSSPFEDAVAPSPEDELQAVQDAMSRVLQLAEEAEEDEDVDAAIEAAAAAYDASVSSNIDDLVTAHETRKAPKLLRQVARVNAASFGMRAVMTTQHDLNIAAVVSQDSYETDEFAARLVVMHEEKRADAILRLANAYLGAKEKKFDHARLAMAAQFDYSKLAHAARTDWYEQNLEFETLDATWELDRGQQYMNLFTPMNGAPVMPRAQTSRERIVHTITNALGAGFQGGAAMGPEAGIGMAALNLGAQLWAMGG